ncbi:MAG: thioredoxin-disulfide reductase [Candidatus Omnitrophota bacterium]|nr:thioredoxin-disulfide reductase [Candidatus Omnitrophota bacterium]
MYDLIIIGGGAAGLTAGMYASRGGLKTILFEKGIAGGLALTTDVIENYPGFSNDISGIKLMGAMAEQAKRFGVEIVTDNIVKITEQKVITTQKAKSYKAPAVIIAAGANPGKLGIPGEKKLTGKGVSYCATCDGPLFKGKDVAVVGGGNTAIEEALFLTKYTNKVTVIHRRNALRADKILRDRAISNPKIDFFWQAKVSEIIGNDKLDGIKIENVISREIKEIYPGAIFIYIGFEPNTGFLKGAVDMDKEGYIITDENMKTSVEGIYACGDCRKKMLRQIVTACSEGATAAVAALRYLESRSKI